MIDEKKVALKEVLDTESVFGGNVDYLREVALSVRSENLEKCKKIGERLEALQNSPIAHMTSVRYEIAVGLLLVNDQKLYDGAFESIYEFSGKVLHFKRVTTSMYIKVARYLLKHDRPETIWGNTAFSMTHLYEMSKIPVKELTVFVESGQINPQMTVEDIKDFVKAYKSGKVQAKKELEEKALQPIREAHEDFHKAYNALKEHLVKEGDTEGADNLLPEIMDAVVRMYNAKLEADLPVL